MRFKEGDVVVIIECGRVGTVEEVATGFTDYHIKIEDDCLHGFDDYEVRGVTKLDKLLLGLDTEDNAVYNKAEDKT
jgi:hypothetical protein